MTKKITKENSKKTIEESKLQKRSSQGARRHRLSPLVRYFIIASWGIILAVTISYLLNDLGY